MCVLEPPSMVNVHVCSDVNPLVWSIGTCDDIFSTGEFEDAIDTLNLAIGLIKQSVTGHTETSHIIIQTLSDCLRGVEEQSTSLSKSVHLQYTVQ